MGSFNQKLVSIWDIHSRKIFSALCILCIAGCGEEIKEVKVPGPTVEVLVPVEPPEEPAVVCQVFTDLSSPLISHANNTSINLPLTHSVQGDLEIGLDNLTLTVQPDDTKPFDEFLETDAEDVTANFALRCNFKFEVTNAGTHTFTMESDDGSQLYVNGVKVVDNGGAHAMTVKSGNVSLPVGIHEMRLLYFEGSGPKGLNLKVQRPNIIPPIEDL